MFTESFIEKLALSEYDRKKLVVSGWMVDSPPFVAAHSTLREAAQLMKAGQLSSLIVTNRQHKPCGLITAQHIIDAFLNNIGGTVEPVMQKVPIIDETAMLTDLIHLPSEVYAVTDSGGVLCGMLTETAVCQGIAVFLESYAANEKSADILHVILEKAYEGIAVVDEKGIIIEFNEAYSKFTGVPRMQAIGRHVTEIIDNTNLHETVRKGIPERGVLQNIQGQDMIVHRIPIWKNGKVAGAIGMLIFEGVSDIYRIYERLQLQNNTPSEKSVSNPPGLNQIIGSSELLADAKRKARTAAQTGTAILLAGEQGTEKDAFAASIHQLSTFASGRFEAVSCTEGVIEKKLEAISSIKGTVYLQHIDELPGELQQKLAAIIRNLQNDAVRLIVSSEHSLAERAEADEFSSELYTALNPLPIHIPPLRERKEDIPFLLAHYMQEICFDKKIEKKTFSPAAVSYLMHYPWPENINELISAVKETVAAVLTNIINQADLPKRITQQSSETTLDYVREKQDAEEKRIILELLERTDGNKSKTAELLGIHRTTLYKKLKKYDILT